MEETYSVKMAKSASYNFTSIIVTFIISALTSIIAARIFGPEKMGIFGFVIWIINTSYVFIGLGLPQTTQRYVAEFSASEDFRTIRGIFTRTFKIIGVISLFALAILFILTFSPVVPPDLRIYLAIGFINLPFGALSGIINGTLAGLQRFDLTMKINIFNISFSFLLICLALFSGAGLIGVLIAGVFSTITGLIIYLIVIRRVLFFEKTRLLPDEIWKRIFRYALSFAGIALIDAIVWQRSEVFFLKIFRKSAEVAFYSIPFGLTTQMMIQLPAAVFVIVLSAVAFMYAKNDLERTRRIYYFSSKYLAILTIPICGGGIVLANELIGLLYGTAYLPAARVLQILLVSGAVAAIGGAGLQILYGTEKQNFVLKYGLVIATYTIVMDIFLIIRYGAIGAAIGNSSAQIIAVVIILTYVCYFQKFKFPWLSIIKIIISVLIMSAGIYFLVKVIPNYVEVSKMLEAIKLLFLILLGFIIYVIFLIVSRVFNSEDIFLLKNLNEKIPVSFLRKFLGYILNFIEKRSVPSGI